jgi:hypothetical protein
MTNEPAQESTATRIWDQISRVPAEHLKSFKRGGGFSGTAIKPMWTIHRMTEAFGPCGIGWGMTEPTFQVVPAGNEILVFCTVGAWVKENGDKSATVFGVGGDKVAAARSSGIFADDEAFKKAFTDALTNALKHFGAGADIHMGLWDGNKYADEQPQQAQKQPAKSADGRKAYEALVADLRRCDVPADCDAWWLDSECKTLRAALPNDWLESLKGEFRAHKESLIEKTNAQHPFAGG